MSSSITFDDLYRPSNAIVGRSWLGTHMSIGARPTIDPFNTTMKNRFGFHKYTSLLSLILLKLVPIDELNVVVQIQRIATKIVSRLTTVHAIATVQQEHRREIVLGDRRPGHAFWRQQDTKYNGWRYRDLALTKNRDGRRQDSMNDAPSIVVALGDGHWRRPRLTGCPT
jgi:hypothetical protein